MPPIEGGQRSAGSRRRRGDLERRAFALLLPLALAATTLVSASASGAQEEFGAIVFPGEERGGAAQQIAVLPFRLNSEGNLGFLTESLDELLAQRIEAGGDVGAVATRDL